MVIIVVAIIVASSGREDKQSANKNDQSRQTRNDEAKNSTVSTESRLSPRDDDAPESKADERRKETANRIGEDARPVPAIKPKAGLEAAVTANDSAVFQGHRYDVVRQRVSWHEAKRQCEALGGQLAIVESVEEQQFLDELVGTGTLAWLGGYVDEKGRWFWNDNTPIPPSRRLDLPGQMRRSQFVCQRPGGILVCRDANGYAKAPNNWAEAFICEWSEAGSEAGPDESREDRLKRLTEERDAALAKGDAETALRAVETITTLDGGDVLERKLEVIMQLCNTADSPAEFKVVAENLVPLVEEAISDNRKDAAERHIDDALVAARKSGDSDLVRRATLNVLKVQQMKSP